MRRYLTSAWRSTNGSVTSETESQKESDAGSVASAGTHATKSSLGSLRSLSKKSNGSIASALSGVSGVSRNSRISELSRASSRLTNYSNHSENSYTSRTTAQSRQSQISSKYSAQGSNILSAASSKASERNSIFSGSHLGSVDEGGGLSRRSTARTNTTINSNRRFSLPTSVAHLPEIASPQPSSTSSRNSHRFGRSNSVTSFNRITPHLPALPSQRSTPVSRRNSPRKISTETVLRKYFENGKWFEEATLVTLRKKSSGGTQKTSKTNVRELDADEVVGLEDSIDKIQELNLAVDRNAQRVSRHAKGIMQDDQQEFNKEVLASMNVIRNNHGLKPFKLSEELSDYARNWARHLAKTGEVKSRNRRDLGDSLYIKESTIPWEKISGDDVVQKLYEDISAYNFDEPSELSSGNFSQIVWKSSKSIGAGIERSKDGQQAVVVVYYYPKGNWPGSFKDQVPPVGGFEKLKRNEKGQKVLSLPDDKESFPKAVLKAHNFYRLKHSATPLVLDPVLSKYAQQWAEKLAEKDKLQHRSKNIYGENIYRTVFEYETEIPDIPGSEPVAYWYSRKSKYDFKIEPHDLRAAPFTQLVWADSRDLGVGVAKSKSNKFYVVTNYNPPGNLLGQFTKKVFPLKWNTS